MEYEPEVWRKIYKDDGYLTPVYQRQIRMTFPELSTYADEP